MTNTAEENTISTLAEVCADLAGYNRQAEQAITDLKAKLARAEKRIAAQVEIINDMEAAIRAGRIELTCDDCDGEGQYETLDRGDPDSGKRVKCATCKGAGSIAYETKIAE